MVSDAERMAREQYGYMAWALDHPELGPVLRQAASEGWDPIKLRGRIYNTNWFKQHGTAMVGAQIKTQARQFLVPLSEESARKWAFQILTGEVQGAEFVDYLRQQAKSRFPGLAGAIDRGITVEQYVDPYRQLAARELEVTPESIDFNDAKWSRLIDKVDPKTGQRVALSQADALQEIRTNSVYGYDKTTGARREAARLNSELTAMFGVGGR